MEKQTIWHRLQKRPWATAGFGLAWGLILLGFLDIFTGGGGFVPMGSVIAGTLLNAVLLRTLRKTN